MALRRIREFHDDALGIMLYEKQEPIAPDDFGVLDRLGPLSPAPDTHPSLAQRLVAVTLASQVGASLR
jgi:hypothetical protein